MMSPREHEEGELWLLAAARGRVAPRALLVLVCLGATVAFELSGPNSFPLVLLHLAPVGLAAWTLGWAPSVGAALVAGAAAVLLGDVAHVAPLRLSELRELVAFRIVALGFFGAAVAQLRAVVLALTEASERDPLTGLLNRRGFARRAGAELLVAARSQRPLSVAYLDVDAFKQLNDVYGHLAGDRVLEVLGRVLARGRASDVSARMGGDEFVVLFPGTSQAEAANALERVRTASAAALTRLGLPVTFTAGLVTFERAPANVEALLREADRRMYLGKRERKQSARGLAAVPPAPRRLSPAQSV